jgi:glutamine amidotransferase
VVAQQVAIVNSGGANIASLDFALRRLGVAATLTTDAGILRAASHVILPGVGAAADAMQRLRKLKLDLVIRNLEQPVLGICLGMQLLGEHSAEDDAACLGILPGMAVKLPVSAEHPVPNMGWCPIRFRQQHTLLQGIDEGSYFYFLHSYALPASDLTLATAAHVTEFSAVVVARNFCGTQFHPERSAAAGARLLQNFLAMGT